MTAEQTKRVIEEIQTLIGIFITAICQPTIGLQQDSGPQIAIAIPPVTGAGRRAAGAENALIESIKLLAFVMALQCYDLL